MWRLIIIDERNERTVVPFLRERISIGRQIGNTIRLTERNISRLHASLTREGKQIFVDDHDSFNGVWLNGARLARKTTLHAGDLLRLGDYQIQIEQSVEGKPPVLFNEEEGKALARARETDTPPPGALAAIEDTARVVIAPNLDLLMERALESADTQQTRVEPLREAAIAPAPLPRAPVRKNTKKRAAMTAPRRRWGLALIVVALAVALIFGLGYMHATAPGTAKSTAAPAASAAATAPVSPTGDMRQTLIDKSMKAARDAFGAKHWQEAMWALDTLLKDIPDLADARELRERAAKERRNEERLREAAKLAERGQWPLAFKFWKSVETESESAREAKAQLDAHEATVTSQLLARMKAAAQQGRKDEALDLAEQVLSYDSTQAEAKRVLATLKTAPAAAEANGARAAYDEAVTHFKAQRYLEAIEAFKKALAADAGFANAERGLGTCYALTGQADQALAAYKRYLALSPHAADADQVRRIITDYDAHK